MIHAVNFLLICGGPQESVPIAVANENIALKIWCEDWCLKFEGKRQIC